MNWTCCNDAVVIFKASDRPGSCIPLRRLLASLALLLAFSVFAGAGQAGQACCPMSASDAPCHAQMIGDCRTACALCQVKLPQVPGMTISCPLTGMCHAAPVGTAPNQILVQPATPPPRV